MNRSGYRSGRYGQHLSARDIEYHWDSLYDTGLSESITKALDQFTQTLTNHPGICPLVRNANNLQAVYDYFRLEGADWNAVDLRDSTAFRIGNPFGAWKYYANGVIGGYRDADRAHVDLYISRRGAPDEPTYDGEYPSWELSAVEDTSTGHPSGDVKHANSVWLKGPWPTQAPDTLGTGWTAPGAIWRSTLDHEIQHSFPEQDTSLTTSTTGFKGELWSAGAEALAGIPGGAGVINEVPYTWSLTAYSNPGASGEVPVRGSGSYYQGRRAFMAYLAYNFRNEDTSCTWVGMHDDLMYRWSRSDRSLQGLRDRLGDESCWTCRGKSSFLGLSNTARLSVLHHNWRVANFLNNPAVADSMLGYPPEFGFSPASNQRAWQVVDTIATNDIVVIPAVVTVGPNQAVRETTFTGERSFRGATYPLVLTPFGSNYWAFRADPQLAARDQDLVIRVSATSAFVAFVVGHGRPLFSALSFMASAVAYGVQDSTEESILWRHPEAITAVSPIQSAGSDTVSSDMEFVIPHFGRDNKSALLVLTTGDAVEGNLETWDTYVEAQPYRLDVSLRTNPADSTRATILSPSSASTAVWPEWSPLGDEVVYTAYVPSENFVQLYRQKLDGSAATPVLPGWGPEYYPDWSPRGDLLAIMGGMNPSTIWVLNPNNPQTPIRRLTNLSGYAEWPAFQPDGQGVAYVHRPGGSAPMELRYVAIDGSGDRVLDTFPQQYYQGPRWNPTGTRLYLVKADGKLYSVPKTGGTLTEEVALGMPPLRAFEFHPGSGRALIETTTPIPNRCKTVSDGQIFFVPSSLAADRLALIDTTAAHRDTSYRFTSRNSYGQRDPRYSPDGTRIAFTQLDSLGYGRIGVGRITPNHAPVLQPIADVVGYSCVPLQRQLSASDPDGETVSYRADEMPPGATFSATGLLDWPLPPVGTFWAVLRAMDHSGGVATRVVKFTIQDGGFCGDPVGEDPPPTDGIVHHRAGQASLRPGTIAATVSNSLLDGADPEQWSESTSRLAAFTTEPGGLCQGTLRARLAGTTTLDRAELVIVDHPATASAFATPQGVLVGARRPLAHLADAAGQELAAVLTAGNGEAVVAAGGAAFLIEADSSASALVLECARLGQPGTGDSTGLVVEAADGASWRELGRVYPRRSRDTLAVATGGAARLRLTPLSQVHLWAVDALEGSDSLAALTAMVTRLPASTSLAGAAAALAFADSASVELGNSQAIALAFEGPPMPETGVRSLFLKLRGRYTQSVAGQARNQQAEPGTALSFALHPGQPNPFAHGTTIRFDTPVAAFVRIEAFDAGGRRVRTLANGQYAPGTHALPWNGADDAGRALRPGVYLVRMLAGSYTAKRRMVLLGN